MVERQGFSVPGTEFRCPLSPAETRHPALRGIETLEKRGKVTKRVLSLCLGGGVKLPSFILVFSLSVMITV